MPRTKTNLFLILLVASCDNTETSDVEVLQARAGAIAAQQSALDEQLDVLTAKIDGSKAREEAEAAGKEGRFFEMHDRLYENSRDITRAKISDWAGALELDVREFRRDMSSAAVLARIKARRIAAGTPRARVYETLMATAREER